MKTVWLVLYNLFVIPLLWGALRLAAIWNHKVRRGLQGRQRLFSSLHAKLSLRGARRTFWVHVASMGEFEQAKPVLERIKADDPSMFVLVTFFSPSGFDHSQDYSHADAVAYLPFDSYGAASRFVSIVHPVAALFVRYELWLNHLHVLHRANVPLLLACTSSQSYTRANGIVKSYLRAAYRQFNIIFCNDEHDREVFTNIFHDASRCIVTGDTRFDRVVERAHSKRTHPPLPDAVVKNKTVLVAGSIWPEDEPVLSPVIDSAIRKGGEKFLCVLAPHEPTDDECKRIEQQYSCCRFSRIESYDNEPVILVDSVGSLFGLYQHATVAYVGGGFGDGVHSVLEPAVFGACVVFGPNIERAHEAQDLIRTNSARIVNTEEEFFEIINGALEDCSSANAWGARAADFAVSRTGASERILDSLRSMKIVA